MMHKSRTRLLSLVVGTMMLAVACGGSATPAATSSAATGTTSGVGASSTKVFTVLQSADAITLDPQNTGDNVGLGIERDIYEGLFGFNENMQVVPELATSWSVSANGLVYTVHLRSGVKFSDGTPFNAQAVKVNFDRVTNKANALNKYALYYIIKSTKAINSTTVQFTLSQPFSSFIDNLAHPSGGMISPAAIAKYGKDVSTHPVGTGPYMLSKWVHGSEIVLKRNPYYWNGTPYFNQVVFKAVPDASQVLAMIKTGEAQFAFPLAPIDVKALAGDSAVTIVNKPSIFVTWISLNNLHPPFNNVDVRLALNYAINRSALISSLYQGYAVPMHSEMGSLVTDFKNVGSYPYDPAKAKALLKQAGYANGFSTTLWTSNSSTSQEEGVFIQQQLAQIGVKVTIDPMEAATLNSALFQPPSKSKMQMDLGGFSPSNGSPDWALRPNFAKSGWAPASFNFGFYSNPTVNQLIQAALATTNPSQDASDYAQVQEQLFKDPPNVWLVVPNNVWAQASNLKDAYVVPDQTLEVQGAYIQ